MSTHIQMHRVHFSERPCTHRSIKNFKLVQTNPDIIIRAFKNPWIRSDRKKKAKRPMSLLQQTKNNKITVRKFFLGCTMFQTTLLNTFTNATIYLNTT